MRFISKRHRAAYIRNWPMQSWRIGRLQIKRNPAYPLLLIWTKKDGRKMEWCTNWWRKGWIQW